MSERIPQSVAYLVVFRAFLATDGKTPATGKSIAMTISKNGGAFGNPNAGATNATEISSGFYKFTLNATDTGTVGPLAWRGAEGTINDAGDVLSVVVDDLSATMKTSVQTAAAAAVDSEIPFNGGHTAVMATLHSSDGTASNVTNLAAAQIIRTGTCQSGSTSSTIKLDSGANGTTPNFYKDRWIVTTGGTGAGQAALCTAYDQATKIATIYPNWLVTPDNTTTFSVNAAAPVDVGLWRGTAPASLDGSWLPVTVHDLTAGALGTFCGTNTTLLPGDIVSGSVLALASAGMFVAPTGLTYADAVAGSPVKETATNAAVNSAASIRSAVGLASANLDAQFTATPAAVWANTTRSLTAFGFTVTLAASQPNYAPSKAGDAMTLVSSALDSILVESGITASAALTNDAGTQLTTINGRQALAACLSALAAVLSGAATTDVEIKPAGKPSAASRISATVDSDGNRSAINLKVPT